MEEALALAGADATSINLVITNAPIAVPIRTGPPLFVNLMGSSPAHVAVPAIPAIAATCARAWAAPACDWQAYMCPAPKPINALFRVAVAGSGSVSRNFCSLTQLGEKLRSCGVVCRGSAGSAARELVTETMIIRAFIVTTARCFGCNKMFSCRAVGLSASDLESYPGLTRYQTPVSNARAQHRPNTPQLGLERHSFGRAHSGVPTTSSVAQADDLVILAQHHPLYRLVSHWFHGLQNVDEVAALLVANPNVSLLFGHLHRARDVEVTPGEGPRPFAPCAVVDGDDPLWVYVVEGSRLVAMERRALAA